MPGSSETALTKASPLTSKFGYWSKLAQAGESSTTAPGRFPARASRMAAATAFSSVPHFSTGMVEPSVAANCSVD